jgi:hypothetical protein
MCEELYHYRPECFIAVPCRWGDDHPLAPNFFPAKPESGGRFPRQRDWEQYYMYVAGQVRRSNESQGCLVFWLPLQREPRPAEDGPYGQDTYGELGAWRIEMKYRPKSRLVIGAEKGYYGIDVYQRNISADVGYNFPIYSTMEETVAAAINMSQTY